MNRQAPPCPVASACAALRPSHPVHAQYLVGVSGGRDSVALLHALLGSGYRNLIVCHLDHGLRPESGEDARFVAQLAATWGVESAVAREDVGQRARAQRASIETAGRDARLAFFSAVAARHNCPSLLLAHHADDQVETLLHHLARGSGLAGLSGMQPVQTSQGGSLQVIRPLLRVWRLELENYVARHRLEFREDPSNRDPQFTRNRVRHRLIPEIEGIFGRNVREALLRTAEICRGEDHYMESQTPEPALELAVPALRALPLALQRRTIRDWLQLHAVPRISFEAVESVRSLLDGDRAKVNLPGNLHARRRAKRIFIESSTVPPPDAQSSGDPR
jgi:tRNA(Ile)-lysidine synthase